MVIFAAWLVPACLVGGAATAAETFCVDGTKQWSQAEHLGGSLWKEKVTNTIVGFFWKDKSVVK
jgi:hypothetical protein